MTLDDLARDVRSAVRNLRRAPGFAAVSILTLALGIGANTAIFSVVNGIILRPLPYPAPEQLMFLTTQFPGLGFDQFWVSPPEFFEFRELNQSFSHVGAFTTGEANLTAADRPIRVRSAQVTDDLLRALGVRTSQGRLFAPGETDAVGPPPAPGQPPPSAPLVAILSDELWRSAFGGEPIVGRTIDVNGVRREVVGILEAGADVMDNRTEIWLPLGLNPSNRRNRGNHYLYLIGRLKDGVTPQAADAELEALIPAWGSRTGAAQHLFTLDQHRLRMEPVQEELIGSASRAIWMLQAAVGFVLLIACANLANLLLARAETRHREFAVRTALGAGRGRLFRQFLAEGLLLSLAGAALGVGLAAAGLQTLRRLYPDSLPRTGDVSLDWLVLFATLGVSVTTGLVFGFAPLMHVRIKGLTRALREGATRGTTSARHRVRRALVVAEVALAVVLVIGAALLLRTVVNLTRVDAGFDRSRLVTFEMSLPTARYPTAASRSQLYEGLLERLRAVPGVQAATAMSGLPPQRRLDANDTEIDNYTAPPEGPYENVDYYQYVMHDYFEALGVPIVQGRGFTPADAASSGMVAVVNESLVKTFWKDVSPIGQRLRPCCNPQTPWFTVVGVAKDVKQGGLDQKTGTEFYFFVEQTSRSAGQGAAPPTMNVVLRTTSTPSALASAIEGHVRQSDASVPVVRLREMDTVFEESIRRPRLLAQLLGAFAGLALLLAAIGTYGLLSYTVSERRREIGVRMTLGATQVSVLRDVMRRGLTLTSAGLVAGLAGAVSLGRLIASMLFDVQPTDPATLAVVAGTITLVAAAACAIPAWRASRVDPMMVLREE